MSMILQDADNEVSMDGVDREVSEAMSRIRCYSFRVFITLRFLNVDLAVIDIGEDKVSSKNYYKSLSRKEEGKCKEAYQQMPLRIHAHGSWRSMIVRRGRNQLQTRPPHFFRLLQGVFRYDIKLKTAGQPRHHLSRPTVRSVSSYQEVDFDSTFWAII